LFVPLLVKLTAHVRRRFFNGHHLFRNLCHAITSL